MSTSRSSTMKSQSRSLRSSGTTPSSPSTSNGSSRPSRTESNRRQSSSNLSHSLATATANAINQSQRNSTSQRSSNQDSSTSNSRQGSIAASTTITTASVTSTNTVSETNSRRSSVVTSRRSSIDESHKTKSKVEPASKAKKTNLKTHPSHRHPLEKIKCNSTFKCDGCKLHGVGERYVCTQCNYTLHKVCMSADSTITFEEQECKLLLQPLKCRNLKCHQPRRCDACGMTVEGLVYHCEKFNTDFHPVCVKLQSEIVIEDVIFRLNKKGSSKCIKCHKKKLQGTAKNIPGWTYVSNHQGYTFHVHCLMDTVMRLSTANTTLNKNNGASSSSSSTMVLQKVNIPLHLKSYGINIDAKWLKVFESFLKVVLPSLMAIHPAALAVSLVAIGVKELIHFLFEN